MTWGYPARAKLIVLFGDLILALVALAVSHYAVVLPRGDVDDPSHTGKMAILQLHVGFPSPDAVSMALAVFAMLTLVAALYVFDLYDLQCYRRLPSLLLRSACATVAAILVTSTFLVLFPSLNGSGPRTLQALLVAVVLAAAWRRSFAAVSDVLVSRVPTVIVGTGKPAVHIRALIDQPYSPYKFTGFIDAGNAPTAPDAAPILGSLQQLRNLVHEYGVQAAVLATDAVPATMGPTLTSLKFEGVAFRQCPDVAMQLCEELPLEMLSHSWLWLAEGCDLLHRRLMRRIKRLSDLLLAASGLVLSLPLLASIALAIKLDSRGPILYRQLRIGWRGRRFKILKFRSMADGTETAAQWARVDDPRVTRVGYWLRKTHLDELPQLLNVFRGEMSFVGPRPERPEFVAQLQRTIPFYDLRHHVLPGITGWAQVNYPYGASVEDARRKLQYDLFYILHASPVLDARIILKTIQVVLFRRGSR